MVPRSTGAFELKPAPSATSSRPFGTTSSVVDHKAGRVVPFEERRCRSSIPRRAEEASLERSSRAEEEVEDRSPDLSTGTRNEQSSRRAAALERGERAVVTIVRASGSTPQRTGAKIWFSPTAAPSARSRRCYENDAGKAREAIATSGRPSSSTTSRRFRAGVRSHRAQWRSTLIPSRRPTSTHWPPRGWHLGRIAADAGFPSRRRRRRSRQSGAFPDAN